MLLDKRKVSFVTKIGAVVLAVVFVAMYVPLLFQSGAPSKQISQEEQMKQMTDSLKLTAENSPKDVNAWLQLADVYYSQNKLKEAVDSYKKAATIAPKNIKTHLGLSAAYYGLNEVDTATVEIKEVLKIDPKLSLAYFNLGLCMTAKGDLKGAISNFEQYLKMDPKGAQVKQAKDQIAAIKKAEKDTASAFESASKTDRASQTNAEQQADSLKTKALMGAKDPNEANTNDPNAAGSFISIGADANKDTSNPHQ